jgi:putative transposase
MKPVHRKKKVTFNEPGHAHFLTYSCQQRLPLLNSDRTRGWVIEALDNARQKCDFDLWAYVLMPEHVHILIRPRQPAYQMSHILAALKRPVSTKAKEYLVETNNQQWLEKLTVREGQQETFRFWQPGGGYDANEWEDRAVLETIEYIHANPVRRGLAETPIGWPWSSARFWAGEKDVPLLMDSIISTD